MRHFYIDQYSEIKSFLHSLDPRIKIIAIFALIISLILTPPYYFLCFGFYFLLIAVLIFLSRLPLGFILKRSLVIIPFVFMVTIFIPFFKEGESADRFLLFWNVFVKSYLSVLAMILLMATTGFSHLLKALERLRFPRIFTMILSFMYRYIFVLQDELMKMFQAKQARSVGKSRWLHIKALANMLGVLFIRAFERGERVYLAMCARGFNGDIKTIDNFGIRKRDVCFLSLLAVALVIIRILGVR